MVKAQALAHRREKATVEELRLAEALATRASTIFRSSDLDRALPVARQLLRLSPKFGGPALKDEEVEHLLREADIGIDTFKKALTLARKELVKQVAGRPARSFSGPRERKPQDEGLSAQSNGMVANTDRHLL